MSAPKGKRGLKALKAELVAAKEKYKDSLKLLAPKAKPGQPASPWPITVQRVTPPSKDALAYDVSSIVLKLCIDGKFNPEEPEVLPVHVEAPPTNELPPQLLNKIVETVEAQWKADLIELGSGEGWALLRTLKWIEKNYLNLLRLMPELIEHYIGVDDEGSSQRRFTIIHPAAKPKEKGDSEESEGLLSEGEAERAALYYAQKELEKQRQQEEEDRRKKAEGARIRQMHEAGLLHAPPPRLSKKEEEERRKSKQGVRTAKTGPRAKPYDGEGAKERRKGKTKS